MKIRIIASLLFIFGFFGPALVCAETPPLPVSKTAAAYDKAQLDRAIKRRDIRNWYRRSSLRERRKLEKAARAEEMELLRLKAKKRWEDKKSEIKVKVQEAYARAKKKKEAPRRTVRLRKKYFGKERVWSIGKRFESQHAAKTAEAKEALHRKDKSLPSAYELHKKAHEDAKFFKK